MTTVRAFFEPCIGMRIDDIGVFKLYGENYLADHDVHFGGYITMDLKDKKHSRLEPVWQFIMYDATPEKIDDLIEYFDRNPMNGYHIHLYQDHVDAKLY